jgi:hypothetical protein
VPAVVSRGNLHPGSSADCCEVDSEHDIDDCEWTLNYIVENPVKAGLHDWLWVWKRE